MVKTSTPNRPRLAGKIAVVTGGAYGIGRASVERFAREGAKVAIVDFVEEGGREVERLISEVGGEAFFVQADVGTPGDAKRAVEETIARYGGVDVLFNNAGIMPDGTVLTQTDADWDRTMDVNLKAIFLLARAAIPSIIARGGGSIINTASVQGLRGHQNRLAYVTSKHGVIGITRAMAADYARQGIRVNAICPGTIDTPMLHRVIDEMQDRDAALQSFGELHPMGFIGQPEDVAAAALYLASDESRFVTGIALPVDGGYTSLITHE